MLSTPEHFLKNFLWKNIDISINKAENKYIYENSYKNDLWTKFFNRFAYMFEDALILTNYIIILSNIDDSTLKKFLIFYMINCKNYNVHEERLRLEDIDMLQNFIGNNESKFRMFIISMHFYF